MCAVCSCAVHVVCVTFVCALRRVDRVEALSTLIIHATNAAFVCINQRLGASSSIRSTLANAIRECWPNIDAESKIS